MLEIGTLVGGKYKILNLIGQGGMSNVYLAMNERANKQWAIKEVRKEGEEAFRWVKQSLVAETEMLKTLHHPCLPSIVDVIDEKERFLIVMDYIEGNSLQQALDDYGAQPQDKVIAWAEQICDVLQYLHSRKPAIIYRDIKPANIILKPDGRITLIDFGTAREYKDDTVEDTICLGTRGYAAPEQFGGMGQTDERTDIYCLGTTVYHLLTGHNPSKPPYELYPIRHWDPQLSSGLEEIILKCTKMNPSDRYQSVAEVKYALLHQSELDHDFRRAAVTKIAIFVCFALLSVSSGILSIHSYRNEVRERQKHYEETIVQAQSATTAGKQYDLYMMAISMFPSQERGYLELMNQVYLSDGVLSSDEDEHLRELLITKTINNGKTYEQLLAENEVEYADFCYRLGLTYFYSYEGSGNKAMSAYWLNKSIATGLLEQNHMERATRLGMIANYYASLGRINKSGDPQTTYRDYWHDLVLISSGDITRMDNPTTALMIYNETLTQIGENAELFRQEGIGKEEMEERVREISTRVSEDIHIQNQPETAYVMILYKKVQEGLPRALTAIENAFSINGSMAL